MEFGERLKKLRARKGITQEKLAKDLDIPESSIRRLEISKGVPRMDRLKQIASYFKVSTDELLGREFDEEQSEETQLNKDKTYALELFEKITDPEKKKAAFEVLKSLADKSGD